MENVMNVAAWACRRYRKDFGQDIDEMKLHKLLYFAQRESLVRGSDPILWVEVWPRSSGGPGGMGDRRLKGYACDASQPRERRDHGLYFRPVCR